MSDSTNSKLLPSGQVPQVLHFFLLHKEPLLDHSTALNSYTLTMQLNNENLAIKSITFHLKDDNQYKQITKGQFTSAPDPSVVFAELC